jgi:hypothetical protein
MLGSASFMSQMASGMASATAAIGTQSAFGGTKGAANSFGEASSSAASFFSNLRQQADRLFSYFARIRRQHASDLKAEAAQMHNTISGVYMAMDAGASKWRKNMNDGAKDMEKAYSGALGNIRKAFDKSGIGGGGNGGKLLRAGLGLFGMGSATEVKNTIMDRKQLENELRRSLSLVAGEQNKDLESTMNEVVEAINKRTKGNITPTESLNYLLTAQKTTGIQDLSKLKELSIILSDADNSARVLSEGYANFVGEIAKTEYLPLDKVHQLGDSMAAVSRGFSVSKEEMSGYVDSMRSMLPVLDKINGGDANKTFGSLQGMFAGGAMLSRMHLDPNAVMKMFVDARSGDKDALAKLARNGIQSNQITEAFKGGAAGMTNLSAQYIQNAKNTVKLYESHGDVNAITTFSEMMGIDKDTANFLLSPASDKLIAKMSASKAQILGTLANGTDENYQEQIQKNLFVESTKSMRSAGEIFLGKYLGGDKAANVTSIVGWLAEAGVGGMISSVLMKGIFGGGGGAGGGMLKAATNQVTGKLLGDAMSNGAREIAMEEGLMSSPSIALGTAGEGGVMAAAEGAAGAGTMAAIAAGIGSALVSGLALAVAGAVGTILGYGFVKLADKLTGGGWSKLVTTEKGTDFFAGVLRTFGMDNELDATNSLNDEETKWENFKKAHPDRFVKGSNRQILHPTLPGTPSPSMQSMGVITSHSAAVTALPENIKDIARAQANGFASADILSAVISHESGGKIDAKNPNSTATGLMQLLYGTGATFGCSPQDLLDPNKNVKAGAAYLNYLYKFFDKPYYRNLGYDPGQLAIMAYYQGEGAISKAIKGEGHFEAWAPALAYYRDIMNRAGQQAVGNASLPPGVGVGTNYSPVSMATMYGGTVAPDPYSIAQMNNRATGGTSSNAPVVNVSVPMDPVIGQLKDLNVNIQMLMTPETRAKANLLTTGVKAGAL